MGATYKGKKTLMWYAIFSFSSIFLINQFVLVFENKNENLWMSILQLVLIFLIVFYSLTKAKNTRGTFVDFETRKYMNYQEFFLFKKGEWKTLGALCQLTLSKEISSFVGRSSKHYTLYLCTDIDKIALKEFDDYQEAWKFLEEQGKILNIATRDEIKIKRQQAKAKRKR